MVVVVAVAELASSTNLPLAFQATLTIGRARTAESLECSKQADAKGLKGKERKKFRKDCIKEAKGGAAPAAK